VLKERAVKERIREKFGDHVFDPQGEIDRRRMGELVFGSKPAAQSARADLEAIVHPRITERLGREIASARSQPGIEFVVLDAAILLEAGWRSLCDLVIFVDVPDAERLERVARERGWSAEQLRAREESQFSLERKRKEADHVVDNSRHTGRAVAQLEAILSQFAAREDS
jgi:dephospho-CoA kinase